MGRVDEAMRRAAEGKDVPAESRPIEERDWLRDKLAQPAAPTPESVPEALSEVRLREAPPVELQVDPPVEKPVPRPPVLLPVRDRIDGHLEKKVVVDPNMTASSREQYRRLAAELHQKQVEFGVKVAMVTSALAGEGKTLTASNLAMTLSESYRRRTLLIDADLRRPALHTVFSLDGSIGLCEGLAKPEDEKLTLHQVSQCLTVLPAGVPTSDPMGALTSDRMRRLIEEAREAFDWVIVDTPPVGLLSDANLLVSMVDGVLLVVKAGDTPFELVQRAVDTVGKEHILGVVLNRVTVQTVASGYSYHRYYQAAPEGALPPG